MAKKREWRPVSQYFDLDGILNPDQNRQTFKRFVADFGWKEYMFSPVVRSFSKLLAGRTDYNYEDYNEGLEETQKVLSSKSETRNLIFNLKEINDDLYGGEDKSIKEFFDRSSSLIEELKEYEKSLKEEYVL